MAADFLFLTSHCVHFLLRSVCNKVQNVDDSGILIHFWNVTFFYLFVTKNPWDFSWWDFCKLHSHWDVYMYVSCSWLFQTVQFLVVNHPLPSFLLPNDPPMAVDCKIEVSHLLFLKKSMHVTAKYATYALDKIHWYT